MKNTLYTYRIIILFFIFFNISENKAFVLDTSLTEQSSYSEENNIKNRLHKIDIKSPMQLTYNKTVQKYIDSYLSENKKLISKMLGISKYYFPIFEQALDKHGLPLELKYLPIVESSLNPLAKSNSGASGLWQFMYLTGKQYGLNVTSFIDERQDPYKSTESACIYLKKLHDIFGDWNLVLAAYNGGPGYIQQKIINSGEKDFWKLQHSLRQETRNYVPKFIAINYVMNYAKMYDIEIMHPKIYFQKTDTILLKQQINKKVLKATTCLNSETIDFLNPSYKSDIYPEKSIIILPIEAAQDFKINEKNNYEFAKIVARKEFLIDEERVEYNVKKGDYLGKIAREFNVKIHQIKTWNNLRNTKLNINDKLVLFVPKGLYKEPIIAKEYVIQKGDTLWGIAQKLKGVSVKQLKLLNNLENDKLKPGTKIKIPKA